MGGAIVEVGDAGPGKRGDPVCLRARNPVHRPFRDWKLQCWRVAERNRVGERAP
jgi:hypothetical protein